MVFQNKIILNHNYHNDIFLASAHPVPRSWRGGTLEPHPSQPVNVVPVNVESQDAAGEADAGHDVESEASTEAPVTHIDIAADRLERLMIICDHAGELGVVIGARLIQIGSHRYLAALRGDVAKVGTRIQVLL